MILALKVDWPVRIVDPSPLSHDMALRSVRIQVPLALSGHRGGPSRWPGLGSCADRCNSLRERFLGGCCCDWIGDVMKRIYHIQKRIRLGYKPRVSSDVVGMWQWWFASGWDAQWRHVAGEMVPELILRPLFKSYNAGKVLSREIGYTIKECRHC